MLANVVRTSKYNALNFIPLNLFTQFSKMANIYFLFISALQTIPSISISDGVPVQAGPLVVFVIIAMIKDAYEDYQRHKSDAGENEQISLVLKDGKFVETQWQHIKVGQICKIESDKYVPADMVIIQSSDPKGICYVETKNLDGETNMKQKTCHKEI